LGERSKKTHLSCLGGDEAEGDGLVAGGKVSERLESARTLVIVLEEEHVDVEVAQENFGYRLVAAGAEEAAAEVASARSSKVSAELSRRRWEPHTGTNGSQQSCLLVCL
jgi:hypothetical protein